MAKALSNFKMEESELQKAKYVAWFERASLTGMITEDLKKRIAKFEKDNGAITAAMLKKMEDSK